jgi:ubiquinone/menaquinone biosynthesis C-methylase UbiE
MIGRITGYFNWITREWTASDSIENIYDSIAHETYDYVVDYKKRVEFTQNALSQLSKTPKKVLDIATGTGATIEAMPFKKSADILGIDISKNMLEVAKKRFKNYSNIRLKQTNFLTVSFPKESFDLITFEFATRFIPKQKEDEMAKKIASWLKKDGELVIITMSNPVQLIIKYVGKPFGIPKGSNADMNRKEYIKNIFGKYLKHKKTIALNRQVIYTAQALYFKKQ